MVFKLSEIMTLRSLGQKTYHILVFLLFLTYALLDGPKRVISLLIAVAVVLLISFFLLRKKWSLNVGRRNFLLFLSVFGLFSLFLLGQLFWGLNSHSFVIAAPVAIFFMLAFSDKKRVEDVLFFSVLVIVLLAVIEKITGSYIFVAESSTVAVDGSAGVALDEAFFAGAAGLLRAKSIFLGPLSLSAFLIGSAIVLRKNKIAVGLCFLGVVLAISRTGIFLVFLVFLVMLFSAENKNKGVKVFVSTFALFSFVCISLALNSEVLSRVHDALDFSGGSSTNNARVYFWSMAFAELSNYSFSQVVLGENGFYRSVYNNNAESGWLTLLLDFGVLGVSFYLLPLVFIFLKTPFFDVRMMVLILFVANSVFTFCYGVTGCFIYWLVVYCLSNWGRENASSYYS
ncbi:hypothetical protein [Stutzerimonas kirkiae]|uniref:hypothetical protein n=1 Tax=Stutzerimonas kirkiae TaxID=2211392 RepID=UPI0010385B86|nr:hypothetical protein [Stutzerimonas kirkiae]